MLEWILILSMAALGAIAFAYLFKATPASDTVGLQSEKLRHDLARISREEQRKEEKKKAEKSEKKQKPKEEEKKKEKKKEKDRSPPKQRGPTPAEEPPAKVEEEEKGRREIYVPNVPIHNNTPTTKVNRDTRSRSPVYEEKAAKKEVNMPTKRQIERDLSQGFVVVQKKGPPPLTPEQKKEREALRQKEEEEERKREADLLARDKERERKRAEASLANEVSLEDVKAKLNKQKLEKISKQEDRKKVNCVIKTYSKMSAESEEAERRSWGVNMAPEGEDVPQVDAVAYPSLHNAAPLAAE